LSDRPTLDQLVAVRRRLGLAEEAQVEKDWYVVRALATIAAADPGPLQLVFQGGTSLSRAHRVIDRMSEDIDIKIVEDKKHPRPKGLGATIEPSPESVTIAAKRPAIRDRAKERADGKARTLARV